MKGQIGRLEQLRNAKLTAAFRTNNLLLLGSVCSLSASNGTGMGVSCTGGQ